MDIEYETFRKKGVPFYKSLPCLNETDENSCADKELEPLTDDKLNPKDG